MKIREKLKKYWVPIAVFVLATAGLISLLPRSDNAADATIEFPTLIVTSDLPAGTDSSIVQLHVDVRLIPASARASGALASLGDIPHGLLNSHHVVGQQLLISSFDKNQVRAIGEGYVALSIRLDPQRWTGPYTASGQRVDIFDVGPTNVELISADAVIINAPATDIKPDDTSVVTFGVHRESVNAVLMAAKNDQVWVTSK
jgi:hypothetical protein